MRKPYRPLVSILAIIVALAVVSGPPPRAQERVVAKVNGKPITDGDMRLAEAEIGSDLGSLPEVTKRRVLLEFLIENQLFADAAEGQQLGAGFAAGEHLPYWRRRALRDAYFDRSVRDAVNDADARRYYASQSGAPQPEEEVRARHILLDSKERAREVYEKIAHGSDFAQLAKSYSKDPGSRESGGDLGFFGRGQMAPQIEEAAFKLRKGEVSEPFETQLGWHIVRLEERRRRPAPPFEAVRDRMLAQLIHQKAQQVAADLRGRARIEYIDPELRGSVEKGRAGAQPKP